MRSAPFRRFPNQSQIRRRHGFNLENQGSKVPILDLQLGERSGASLAGHEDAEPPLDRRRSPRCRSLSVVAEEPGLGEEAAAAVDAAALDDVALEFLRTTPRTSKLAKNSKA